MVDIGEKSWPLPPLDTAGVGPPGPDFDREAGLLHGGVDHCQVVGKGKDAWVCDDGPEDALELKYLYGRALYAPGFSLTVKHKGQSLIAEFVSGAYYGIDLYGPVTNCVDPGTTMPLRPEVVVIGKQPGPAELASGTAMAGDAADVFATALTAVGVPAALSASWYVTNLFKHAPPGGVGKSMPAALAGNSRPLLAMELWLLRPKYVLCLGGEAIKALFPDESVLRMVGRVLDYQLPLHRRGHDPRYHGVKVACALSPLAVCRKPELMGDLRDGLSLFWDLVRDRPVTVVERPRHVACYSAAALDQELRRCAARHRDGAGRLTVALDAEWHGAYPRATIGGDGENYLRTVQVSTAPGEAVVVVLRDESRRPCFDGGVESAASLLRSFLSGGLGDYSTRIGGHWFRADIPWFVRQLGVDLRPFMRSPDQADATRSSGFDTGYMAHAYQEDLGIGGYGLKSLAARYCRMPPWDLDLVMFDTSGGFGDVPDHVLVGRPESGSADQGLVFVSQSYAAYDADATIRLERLYNGVDDRPGLLDGDEFGLSSRTAYWLNMASFLAFLEMEMNGVVVDRGRADAIVEASLDAYGRLLSWLRCLVRWPNFNPASANQCRELLFGARYNGSFDAQTGQGRRLAPDWASPRAGRPANKRLAPLGPVCLDLAPIKTTGKQMMDWQSIAGTPLEGLYSPSTSKDVLSILGWQRREAMMLRDVRYLNQITKGALAKPRCDDDGFVVNDDGQYEYDGGLISWVDDADGRVRTHFFPVETGRISSSRPNLTNLSSSREEDYRSIMGCRDADGKVVGRYSRAMGGPRYIAPLRSIVTASPGRVLIEADLKSAELCVLAWLSGSRRMRDDVRRSMLSEDDPDFKDLHAQTACVSFGLNCPPTKRGLAAIGKAHLRTGGKTVNYGVAYGLGDKALAVRCAAEGHSLTLDEAARLRRGYFDLYPENLTFFEECKARVTGPGWITNVFGRHRRFHPPKDQGGLAGVMRSAMNAPIQSAVADSMRIALWLMCRYREEHRLATGSSLFDLLVQVHDSVLVECLPEDVLATMEVMRRAMSDDNPFRPCYLDGGVVEGDDVFHFGVDFKVYERWGEPLGPDRLRQLGVSIDQYPGEVRHVGST